MTGKKEPWFIEIKKQNQMVSALGRYTFASLTVIMIIMRVAVELKAFFSSFVPASRQSHSLL